MERGPRPKRKPETKPIDEKHVDTRRATPGPNRGRADDAGHPGGRQDLDAKTEFEDEHV